ncbi:MAG: hypothetical protein SWZ49_17105, partial [Cyanobacteriota bacterium]|nr:hypothetical protein [Cyanobacteriota bacterium]
ELGTLLELLEKLLNSLPTNIVAVDKTTPPKNGNTLVKRDFSRVFFNIYIYSKTQQNQPIRT